VSEWAGGRAGGRVDGCVCVLLGCTCNVPAASSSADGRRAPIAASQHRADAQPWPSYNTAQRQWHGAGVRATAAPGADGAGGALVGSQCNQAANDRRLSERFFKVVVSGQNHDEKLRRPRFQPHATSALRGGLFVPQTRPPWPHAARQRTVARASTRQYRSS
jgi:hypothetical protein